MKNDKDRQDKIKKLLSDNYEKDFKGKGPYLTQISTFFTRFLDINCGDIILIPYNKDNKITIATVDSQYKYDDSKEAQDQHIAHQLSINKLVDVNMDKISNSLANRLRARLTLTRIDKEKYEEIDRLPELLVDYFAIT